MKKKILIVNHAMEIGGAERALLGLLSSFDYNHNDVDLFLCRHEGDLFKYIPKEVNILKENQANCLATPMKSLLIFGKLRMLYGRLKAKILSKYKIKKLHLRTDNQVEITYSHRYTYKYINFINPQIKYDLAISFITPHYICMNKCNAKVKVAWIHTDYTKIDLDIEEELKMWSKYDYIVSISDECTKGFLYRFPSLKDKILRVDNIITDKMINSQANSFVVNEFSKNVLNFLSVGRLTTAKNFDNIPEIAKLLVDKGVKFKWFIVGYGKCEDIIKRKISEFGMEDIVILLGKKTNPYPYIKQCDFYIQPSRYEGKAVTVREAQILEKPVIITRFPTSKSQLEDGVDGIIVEMDNKLCAEGIYNFVTDEQRVNEIKRNLHNIQYSNEEEVNKLYNLIGD